MTENAYKRTNRYGLAINLSVISAYTLITSIYNVLTHGLMHFSLRFAAGIILIILALFIGKNKNIHEKIESFLSPVLFVLMETAVTLFLGSDRYYYFFLIACSVVSLGYLSRTGFVLQVIIVNIIEIIILALKIPIMGANYDMLTHVMFFLAYNLINVLLYSICIFAVGQAKVHEKTSNTFNTIIDTTPSFMVVVDNNAKVEYISHSLAEWLHLPSEKYARNRPLLDLLPTIEMKIMFHEIIESKRFVERSFDLLIDHRHYWFMLRSSKMNKEGINRFFEWSDITPIMEAKNMAEAQDVAKGDFLAKMSHEIRTPMNSIMGMSELILRENLTPGVLENAVGIKNASTNLLTLINDILDFSKIESGKLEIIETDYLLTSLLNDVISIIRMRILDGPVLLVTNIDSRLPNSLCGDEVRTRQVLLNILSNAVKYTSGGFIRLSIGGHIRNNTVTFRIAITDSGIGIRQEDIQKLFGEFVQFDMVKNHGIEGSGLGLAIARNLARAMGGDITVESKYGYGSTFTITLPQKIRSEEYFAFVEDAASRSVLLYEPRTIYSDSIQFSLKNLGIKYQVADNIPHFYEALETGESFSHIFIPSFLSEEAQTTVSKNNSKATIVLLTNYGDLESAEGFRTLAMPVHTLSIANALNDINEVYSYHQNKPDGIHFIAPTVKILIVDDILTNLKVAEGLMLPYQMQIDTCNNGKDAVDMVIANQDYDLIFMDHMMPGMDGIQAATMIRFTEGNYFREVPIIALTANAVSGVKEMFLQNGMNDFLAKPVEMSKLNSILDRWLPNAKKERYTEVHNSDEVSSHSLVIEGIDVDNGIMMTGGNIDNYLTTLSYYYGDGLKKITELTDCLQNMDLPLFTTHIHALKSASASIGAKTLSEAAKALEMAGKKEDINFIEKKAPEFITDLEHLLGKLEESLKTEINSADAIAIPLEALKGKLIKLKRALDNLDIGIADDIIEKIKGVELTAEIRGLMDNISQNILIFEYEEAIIGIDQILALNEKDEKKK